MSLASFLIVLALSLALLALVLWYLPVRLARLLALSRRWPLVLSTLAIAGGYLALQGAVAGTTQAWIGVGAYAFGLATFTLLYAALALLALDLLRLAKRLPSRAAVASVFAIALAFTGLGVANAYELEVVEVEMELAGLPQEVTIMHLADVHVGNHRGADWLARIVDETNRHAPDLVLLNGDLIDSNLALEPGVLDALARIKAPTYFVNGNHEVVIDHDRALAAFRKHGVRVLVNEVVETHGLQLVGLDYMSADKDSIDPHAVSGATIQETLPTIELADDRPTLLMHHSPIGVSYVADRGIDIMLAGHTHAGQVFPGPWLAGLQFPYLRGLYEAKATQVFVSQGVGTFGVPLRLGSSNQMELIRLKPTPAE